MTHQMTTAYLYKWTHIPTAKWYVGSRTAKKCHPDDGYICSSKEVKPMILENSSEWQREILVVGEPEYIRELENKYLKSLNAAKDPMSFNKHNADGKAGQPGIPRTESTKAILRVKCSGWNHSEETRKHFSKIREEEGNPFFGKHHTEETKNYFKTLYTGKKQSEEQIQAKSSRQTGVERTHHAKAAISQGVLALPKVQCENCMRLFSPALYGRWHGSKCKMKGA